MLDHKRFTKKNEGFICEQCGKSVLPTVNDTYRDHCPFCLYSKHVDINPGDRQNECEGRLKPIGMEILSGGNEYRLIYVCQKCGETVKNKMARRTSVQPDNFELAITLRPD